MKKLMTLAATLAMVILAASPAMAQNSAVEGQYGDGPGGVPGEPVSATGVVEPLGPTTFMYGTHDLAGSGYVISSETVDLSEYEGEEVTVHGTLAIEEGELEGGPPLIDVSSVEPSGGEEPGGEAISGVVLEVGSGSVLIEDASGGQYDFAITESTGFVDGLSYIPENAPPRNPTAADLAPGLEVSVVPAGAIAESFPAQGEAASITFLSPWYDGGDDGGEDPIDPPNNGGNDGDGSGNDVGNSGGDSGSVADMLGVTTLPDTGGAMLPALGIGAALVAGGLLVRRMSR